MTGMQPLRHSDTQPLLRVAQPLLRLIIAIVGSPPAVLKSGRVAAAQFRAEMLTLSKFNMEPDNDGFQKEFPFPGADVSGSVFNFRGVPEMGSFGVAAF